MPKGKNKSRNDRHRVDSPGSDDESYYDNGSIASSVSDIHSVVEDVNGGEQTVDETPQIEVFEDQLKEAIDGATQKSTKGRESCLLKLVNSLCSRVITDDFIINRYISIMDVVEHSLKKGKGEEQSQAAILAVVLCIQLGAGLESEKVFRELKPIFLTILADTSASPKARAKCAMALGLCTYIVPDDGETLYTVMRALETSFSGSYLKGDDMAPSVTSEMAAVHSHAVAAWCLLLTLLPPSKVLDIADSHMYKLPGLLESTDLDLRIVAGETIALFYEIAYEEQQDIDKVDYDELCSKLKELATDSHKYRARKDRKQQRSCFREILQAVEGGDINGKYLSMNIKFGREILELDSWRKKREYEAFRAVLGSGMNHHLADNMLLRDIYELGEPLGNVIPTKASKSEKHFANNAAFKMRTKARNKVRDKRNAVLA